MREAKSSHLNVRKPLFQCSCHMQFEIQVQILEGMVEAQGEVRSRALRVCSVKCEPHLQTLCKCLVGVQSVTIVAPLSSGELRGEASPFHQLSVACCDQASAL